MDEATESRTYRASVVLMFDYEADSIEEARKFGKDLEQRIAAGLEEHDAAVYSHSALTVKRTVKKDKGVGKPQTVITVGTLPADEVFNRMKKRFAIFEFDGREYKVRMHNHRLRCFKKNRTCVVCGTVGTEMRLERNWTHEEDRGHFNLYGLNRHGHWVLMTVDHIVPLAKGGADHPDNFQTMCSPCNGVKKDDHLTVEEVRHKLGLGSFVVGQEASGV